MDLELTDKVVIITGGTQGIGRATALRLAAEGCRVVIAARGKERLDAVAAGFALPAARSLRCRRMSRSPPTASAWWREALKAFGRIDILVNNAVTSLTGEFGSAWSNQFLSPPLRSLASIMSA